MNLDLKPYVEKGITIEEYVANAQKEIDEEQDEAGLLEYTKLNQKRMKRLFKTFRLNDQQKDQLQSIQKEAYFLIISESWCGDASQIIPIIYEMAQHIPNVEAKVVYRDQNPELMGQYETNNSRAIPIIVGVDESFKEFFRFGPRPSFGMELLKKHKENPESYPKSDFYPDLQKAYNQDKGQTTFTELYELLTQ